jgi:hypothetical protein
MKDFFKQCLEDLESLTGIRQLYFMQIDPDGPRKISVLIAGMLETSKQFSYISEADQQRIIREQMAKDQDYDSLNSRTIYKWLNMNKDFYFMDANSVPEAPRVALSDEEKERIDQLANQFKMSLMGDFKPQYKDLEKEIETLKLEDEERLDGKRSSGYVPDPNNAIILEKKLQAARSRGLDKLELNQIKSFVIERQTVIARNYEEALEIYTEVYL